MNSRRTSTPMLGLPKCPLCGHEVAISVMIARESNGFERPHGVDGTCGNCGFRAQRKVEEHLRGATVETVLLECPDEPEPVRMAEFEEFADDWIAGYSGKPLPNRPGRTPPASAATFNMGNPGGGKNRTMFDFGASMKVDFADITVNSKLFDDALGAMKQALDDQIFKSLMFGSASMRVPFQQQGKPKKPQHDPYVITLEFFEDQIQPLLTGTRVSRADLLEMQDKGLIKINGRLNEITFEPSPSMPFDGSREAIAAEFRVRKLFLQARRQMNYKGWSK